MRTMKYVRCVTLVGTVLSCLIFSVGAKAQGDPALAKALTGVTVSLEQGLRAGTAQGTPMSGKFEVEEGKLLLSVYTMKADKFSEVIVDQKTGKITKTEAITGGDDLTAAKAQAAALAAAKGTLLDAVARAVKANAGARAVSATAEMDAGHPVAMVMLLKGQTFTTVSEKLD
jgi:hypothetical protein